MEFIKYEDKFKDQVFPELVPNGYYNKYTSRSLFYKVLRLCRVFKSDLFILINENIVSGCILVRKRFSLSVTGFRWFIYGVAVSQEHRGRGYGTQLILNCLEYCKMHNINEIFLFVDKKNTNAQKLYSKHGFEAVKCDKWKKAFIWRHKDEYLMRRVIV